MKKFLEKKQLIKYGLPLAFLLGVWVILAWKFDFYYISNDDSVMNAVLSGAFTGEPDGHDFFHAYLLGWPLKALYSFFKGVSWYGVFLCVCQFGSLYVCLVRCVEFAKDLWQKVLVCFLGVFFVLLAAKQLVLLQFTFVSAMLASAAIFLVATDKNEALTVKAFLKRSIPSLLLYAAGFCVRKQIGLFFLPFLGMACLYQCLWNHPEQETSRKYGKIWIGTAAAGVFCALALATHMELFFALGFAGIAGCSVWYFAKAIPGRTSFLGKYALYGLCLAGMLAVVWLVNQAAYSSPEWKEYQMFSEAQVSYYDFGVLPAYEDEEAWYQEIGISPQEQKLLERDNFGISDKYDTPMMQKIEAYQNQFNAYKYTVLSLKRAIVDMAKRIVNPDDMPYNMLLVLLYAAAAALFALERRFTGILFLADVFLAHMLCWGYLMWGNRVLARVTNSLYLAEILLLTAVCLQQMRHLFAKRRFSQCKGKAVCVMAMWGVILLAQTGSVCISMETELENLKNTKLRAEAWETVEEYCSRHPKALYLLDGQSFCAYSEKVFPEQKDSIGAIQNFTFCGGWVANMPPYYDKLAAYGVNGSFREYVRDGNALYFITDRRILTDWLRDYLEAAAWDAKLSLEDSLVIRSDDGKEVLWEYDIYKIR